MTDNTETLRYRVERLEAELQNTEDDLAALEAKIESRDRNQLIAGVVFLGGIVTTLIGVIWANLSLFIHGK